MTSIPLQPRLVRDVASHRALDPALFDFVFEVAKARGLRIEFEPDHQAPLVRLFDKLFWAPGERVVRVGRARRELTANDFLHIAIHEVFFERFGMHLDDNPLLSFLAEAMASCAEVYWTFVMSRSVGLSMPEMAKNMHLRLSADVNRRFVKVARLSAKRPGAAYAQLVDGFLAVYEALWHHQTALLEGRAIGPARLQRALHATPHPWLCSVFDFANNVFFVRLYLAKGQAFDLDFKALRALSKQLLAKPRVDESLRALWSGPLPRVPAPRRRSAQV